jgi:hypothetical protein
MIIADLDYIEKVVETSEVQGGRRRRRRSNNTNLASLFTALSQSLSINPASTAANLNMGGNSIGNTAVSFNISMPILIAISGDGNVIGIANPIKNIF